MSLYRRAAKVDTTSAELVKALRECHIEVYVIRWPADLLLRLWCTRHQFHCWQPLEVKTAYGVRDPKPRVRSDQRQQTDFLELTETPVATNLAQAIAGINRHHQLGIAA